MTQALTINPYNYKEEYANTDLSNISDKGKDYITIQGMPDYSKGIEIENTQVFIPPVNGILISGTNTSNAGNGTLVYYGNSTAGKPLASSATGKSNNAISSYSVKLNKGENYYIYFLYAKISGQWCTFYPFKGAQ